MCPTNWYTLGAFIIIFQRIPVTDSKTRPPAGCKPRERFATTSILQNHQKKRLNKFKLTCTAMAVFEIRFTNGELCDCGKITRVEKTFTDNCKKRFSLDAMVNISVANVRSRWGENCTFEFHFLKGGMRLKLFMKILPVQVVRSSYLVYNTHVITSYVTSTVIYERTVSLIGQHSTTSSPLMTQSKLKNLTRISTRMRSTVNPQSSQSSHAIPFYTGIVITPTKINMSTLSFVYHSPDLATSSFPTKPVVVMSSHAIPVFSDIVVTPSAKIQPTNSSVSHSPDLATSNPSTEPVAVTSSHEISYLSKIVITPTSTIQPSNSSVYHSSDLATTSLPTDPVMVTSSLKENPVLKTSTFIKSSPTTSVSTPSSTLSADEKKRKQLKEDLKFIKNVNTSTVAINDTETISKILDAAANLINTNITNVDQKEDPGMLAVHILQNLGQTLSRQLVLGNESSVTFQNVTEDLVFGAAVINVSSSPGFKFPSEKYKISGDEEIDIPKSIFVSEAGKAYFVGMIFRAYREMRDNTGDEGFVMGTKVINAIVSPAPSKALKDPVEMTFEKSFVGQSFAEKCSFYIENNSFSGEYGRWSTKQCFVKVKNKSHVQCKCYHFTNFAVLFKINDDQTVSEEDSFRLVIITYIGLSLSILGCLLTFLIYISLSNIKTERATIHTNLVLALGIADVIFLVTVAVKPDGDSCLAVAILAFYFYLAVFFWMLVEGVYIYLMVIKVFRGNVARRRRLAYLVGWGCPIIIAVVTLAVLTDDVVSKYHCWLSVESGAIWAFVGPGLFVILVNFIILMSVMRTTWAHFVGDKEYGGLKSATKTFGAVVPILGITWVFGVIAFNESSIVFQYIFAITNSIQGLLIFILYCIVNKEVRNELHRRFTVWQTRREIPSSSAGARRPTFPYAVSSEKNTTFNRTTQSAQGTPDLLRYPLNEIKPEKLEEVEQRYSFEDSNKRPKVDLEFYVDVTNGAPNHGIDRDSGKSSPVDVEKVPEVNYDAGDP